MTKLYFGFARKKQLPDLALFVHGGTIMSILEAYGTPRKSYYDWHLKNGEGWAFTLTPGGQITDNSVLLRVEKKISR